jgi:glycosyltransferase involved in cell wall biosynthesis
MPKVTMLMSVYNGARFLREAIESILGQTFRDFEFLIVDDGSTDDSREMILSYCDPRVRLVINDRNVGLPRSLNRGLDLAQGEYVARQDADDISESARLAKQVAFLDSYHDVALLGTWYRKIDEGGRIIGDRQLPCDHVRIRWCQLFFCPFVHTAIMLRKSPVL